VRKFEEIGRFHERNMSSGYLEAGTEETLITPPPPSLSVER
jgi:hypothetical protein